MLRKAPSFLVAAALVSSWLITVAEITQQVVDLLRPFMDHKILLMLVMALIAFGVVGIGMPRFVNAVLGEPVELVNSCTLPLVESE